jgi:PAS domain S-box-containing protein
MLRPAGSTSSSSLLLRPAMKAERGQSSEEIKRLQGCINDLVTIVALPARWSGAEPYQIVSTLLDVLPGMLNLDLLYVRVEAPGAERPLELVRITSPRPDTPALSDIAAALNRWRKEIRPVLITSPIGPGDMTIVTFPLGLEGEIGALVAGATRKNFPGQPEKLLLDVAASQVVIGLQYAQLLSKEVAEHRLADERLRLEEDQLKWSEARKAAILDSALDSIVTIDHEGRITEFNPAAERTFGYRRPDVLGKLLADIIIPPSLREAHRQGFARFLATGEGRVLGQRLEMSAIRADGTEFPVELTITRVPADGPPAFTGYLRDITERRLAEQELARIRSELAHMTRLTSLGVLTASIAHEVNQPLAGIITNASTCLRMLAATPPNLVGARETAHRTIRDGHRASDVISRLRAMFGKQAPIVEPVDLNEATREVIALTMSELQRRRVSIRTAFADGLPPVMGDRVQLQQVILNLLLNASESMACVEDRPRHILVRTESEDGITLAVEDNGVGIDPQSVEKLFEPFYTTKGGGMGIGLSVSRSIIESHHGRLWATKNEGPGTTFMFSLMNPSGQGQPEQYQSTIASPG